MQNLPPERGPLEILTPRAVPLGGLRALTVRRTLPQRGRSLIGAWCFVDHYGPDELGDGGGMAVPPHPHTGLATVSWLFAGEITHADSAGYHAAVRPGELNLMTAGRGISHSEYSTPQTRTLHGVQLWFALPDAARFADPGFEHYAPTPVHRPGASILVFLGELAGSRSPVTTPLPLLGAELRLEPGAILELELAADFEHGLLLDTGTVTAECVAGRSLLAPDELGYLAPGPTTLTLRAGAAPVRLLLLGGPPFREPLIMWWNFVGRSHEEVVAFRDAWQREIGAGGEEDGEEGGEAFTAPAARYGLPAGAVDAPLPAPALPGVRLRARHAPGDSAADGSAADG